MITTLINTILSLFRRYEPYLVIEIWRGGGRVTSVLCDFKNRNLRLSRSVLLTEKENLESVLRRFHAADHKVVVSLDSELCDATHSAVALVRQNAHAPIDDADLDNLVSQAIWKLFDRERKGAAAKLNASDIDVVLGDVKIWNILLDNHRVLNPLGFNARQVEVRLSQTLLMRNYLSGLEAVLPLERVALITETAASVARVIGECRRNGGFILAYLTPTGVSLVQFEEGRIKHLDSFSWSEENLIKGVSAELRVTPEIARHIVSVYNQGNASPVFLKKLSEVLARETGLLAKGLQNALGRHEVRNLFVFSQYELPRTAYKFSLKTKSGKAVKIFPVSTDFISENLGFGVSLKSGGGERAAVGILCAMLDAYLAPKNETLNSLARRRVKWLLNSNKL